MNEIKSKIQFFDRAIHNSIQKLTYVWFNADYKVQFVDVYSVKFFFTGILKWNVFWGQFRSI